LLIGNDIVDLHDPWSRPDKIHQRFDSRAFTHAEQVRIVESRSAHRLRWTLWAAKESAFKVARKLDAGVRFLPREFAVRMVGDARAEVTHRVGRFSVRFDRADDWLHALAVPSGHGARAAAVGVGARVGEVETERRSASGGDGPSVRVRELARAALGSVMDISPTELEIVTEGGVPTVRRREQRLPVDLSLSHHGRFVACAWRGPVVLLRA